jgi:hypothetical protein
MPYIEHSERAGVMATAQILNAGQLNYALTMVILGYLKDHGKSYQTCNDIVGALDNAKDEFRRRIQHPYEDTKIEANGDVY